LPARPSAGLVDVVIVARNAAATLGDVVARIPRRVVRSVVVVDNGSTDATAQVAGDGGCVVLREPTEGHGAAAGRAVAHLAILPLPPDVVVFMAADGSNDPAEIGRLLEVIRGEGVELVIGVRPGARAVESRVALGLIGLLYRHRFSDVSGFRAIRFPALIALGLRDRGAAWNVEMQVRALALGLKVGEVEISAAEIPPTDRRARLGATGRVLFQILRHATTR
jgi:glycosyltransferase involved in cell wall biosynthesis